MGSPGRAGQQSLVFFPPSLFHMCVHFGSEKIRRGFGCQGGRRKDHIRLRWDIQKSRIHRGAPPNYPKSKRSPILYLAILCPPAEYTFKLSRAHVATLVSVSPQDTVFKMFAQTYGQAKSKLTHLHVRVSFRRNP